MAKQNLIFDVWFQSADTVYKGVPYNVVTDWADQGRLSADDRVRPSGTEVPWVKVSEDPRISDYLFRKGEPASAADESLASVEIELPSRKHAVDEDDDVDMIPLIDISLVLLIFFMMTTVVAALSPVAVPDMKNASELRKDIDAFTVMIDKRGNDEIFYALRLGDQSPKPEDNNLTTPAELLQRLDQRLAEVQRPPEVRIACNKDLPRGLIREIAAELDKRKSKDQIAYYGAEVNERSK